MSLDAGSKVQNALRDYQREAYGRAVPEIAAVTGEALSRVRKELREREARGMVKQSRVQSRTGHRYWSPGPRDEVAKGRGI